MPPILIHCPFLSVWNSSENERIHEETLHGHACYRRGRREAYDMGENVVPVPPPPHSHLPI